VTEVTARSSEPWSPARMSIASEAVIVLDPELFDRVRALSRRTGRPSSMLVREAIVGFLTAREDYRLPSWVAASVRGSDRPVG
jgi:predicted DNA-binding protein